MKRLVSVCRLSQAGLITYERHLLSLFNKQIQRPMTLLQTSSKHTPLAPIVWDEALIRQYDLSGPRYTSYPTAPQFSPSFTDQALASAVQKSNQTGTPLSLYFHIPFCDTVCYYCACNKIITANKKRAAPYLDRLHKELAMQSETFDRSRPVHQLHWGGGTPTYISDDQMRQLMAETKRHFTLLDDDSGEYSIEVHPGRMNVGTISTLREIGFNRLSMGVQDFDPAVQKAVNRFNSYQEVKDLVDAANKEGFHSISMDLIYGLPHQSLASIAVTLEQIITLSPDRISLFNYAHMPHLFKTQNQMDARSLPEPQVKLQILQYAIETLCAAGYVYIGMDHFAKPNDNLAIAQENGLLQRNFQGYATHNHCELLSFGVSAISSFGNAFVQNYKNIEDYNQAIDSGILPREKGFELSEEDRLRQHVINQLICQFRLEFSEVEDRFPVDVINHFDAELNALKPMKKDGLIAMDDRHIEILPRGRLLIRRICMVFDAYQPKIGETPLPSNRFSRII